MKYYANQLAIVEAAFDTESFLAETLSPGVGYTSLAVAPLSAPIFAGQVLTLGQIPAYSISITASEDVAAGELTINLEPFNAISLFSAGATISYAVDPTTIAVGYYAGKGVPLQTLTYTPGGSGSDIILRTAVGRYYVAFDTTVSPTSKPGTWTGAWESSGIGQGYQPFSFSVSEDPV